VFKSSHTKYSFDCDKCKHDFFSPLGGISGRGQWCPYCSNKVLCENITCQSCHDKSFASHEKAQFWSSKNEKTPRQVFKSSNTKYIFDCDKCLHNFASVLSSITIGRWCPYCSNPVKKLCEDNNCQLCHEKSFASYQKAQFWSDKNDKPPRQVFKSSAGKYKFDCDMCRHDFTSALYHITNGGWCPYCSNQQLCEDVQCQSCFDNSFASHEKAQFWSEKNGDILPRQVFKSTHKKYWFDCDKCSHDFYSALYNITGQGSWCPYCSSKQLCEDVQCQSCYDKSFASHEKAQFWSEKNGDVSPRQVFKSTPEKYWFDCDKCSHDFCSALSNVNNGTWCPKCINKTEQKLFTHLQPFFPELETQFRADWCMNHMTGCHLPFDFVLCEEKIIIELDGPQHFVQVSNWQDPDTQFEKDEHKQHCANEHGFSVIRLRQEDVFYDTYDWVQELMNTIHLLASSEQIENVYLCQNQEYTRFSIS